MSQNFASNIVGESKYSFSINEIKRDISEIYDTDSIKNQRLDATPFDVVYIKKEANITA